jgi:hypothetical protein
MRILRLAVLSLLISFQALAATQPNPQFLNYDLPAVLKMTLDILTREPVRKLLREEFKPELKIDPAVQAEYGLPEAEREVTESQLMELLLKNRDMWAQLNEYLKDIPKIDDNDQAQVAKRKEWRKKFKQLAIDFKLHEQMRDMMKDPLHAMPLYAEGGKPGYTNMKFVANHPILVDKKWIPAGNLKQNLLNFIALAKKEIVVNVFDFDLIDVAQALIDKAASGVKVRVGVDGPNVMQNADIIAKRPNVKTVYDMLSTARNLTLTMVKPVGLNHQKLVAIDWSLPDNAKVLMSSGNFTQSCIGPEGDGVKFGMKAGDSPYSIPNANHQITVDSYVLANLINHELSKTLDAGYQLRGSEYPTSGAYQIFGDKGFDAKKDPNMIIAFTPGGGLGDVNRDIIAQVIRRSTGSIRMVQFVTSSKTIEEALFNKMRQRQLESAAFDFRSVADTPFATRDFSTFMAMSGWDLAPVTQTKGPKYVSIKPNRWLQNMSVAKYKLLKNNIQVAPESYGTHYVTLADGTKQQVDSKIHHKMLATKINGQYVTITGSYNFSDAAGSNQEYIVVIMDKDFSRFANGIYNGLAAKSAGSVESLVLKRNNGQGDPNDAGDAVDASDAEVRMVEAAHPPKP